MKDKYNLIKFFMKKMYVLLFNLRHLIHIPSFRIINLLCCRGPFTNVPFNDVKTKFISPYLLDVSY